MGYTIQHNQAESRFETEVEGYKAVIDYTLRDNTMNIYHTGVPQQIEGRGIAAALTKFALEYAKENGLKVVPTCRYARVYIQRNSEYADLLQ